MVQNCRKSYTINYKLRVLSWLQTASIPCGPSKFQQPTIREAADQFKIPFGNLGRRQREEKAGRYLEISASARRLEGERKEEEMG